MGVSIIQACFRDGYCPTVVFLLMVPRRFSCCASSFFVCRWFYMLRFSFVIICSSFHITKTYLYNFDPLKPHFYIVKLGFTGVYIIFVISAQKHRLSRPSNEYPLNFEQKHEKYQNFLCEKLPIFGGKIFSVFE